MGAPDMLQEGIQRFEDNRAMSRSGNANAARLRLHYMKRCFFSLRSIIIFALASLPACGLIPTLQPAVGFDKGSSQIPPGHYLFVEYTSSMLCYDPGMCPCPAPEPVHPAYAYSSKILHLTKLDDHGLTWHWTTQDLPGHTDGFMGYGLDNSHIYSITGFPYQSHDMNVIIYSVDSQGKIAAQVFGETYFFKPGQTWEKVQKVIQLMPPGCHVEFSSRVTNHGFVTKDQIENDY